MSDASLSLAVPCRADEPAPEATVAAAWAALAALGGGVRLREVIVCVNGPAGQDAATALRRLAHARGGDLTETYADRDGDTPRGGTTDDGVAVRIVYTRRTGKAIAWNLLRHYACGPLVVFLDADVQCAPGALSALLEALQEAPGAVLAGGRTVAAPRAGWFERVQATPYAMDFPNLSPQMYAARLDALPPAMPEGLIEPERWLELTVGTARILRVRDATVAVRLPRDLRDFYRQRIRIEMGKIQIAEEYPGLLPRGAVQPRTRAALARLGPLALARLGIYLALRQSAHLVAAWRYRRGAIEGVWRQAASTKDWHRQ